MVDICLPIDYIMGRQMSTIFGGRNYDQIIGGRVESNDSAVAGGAADNDAADQSF